MNSSLVLLLLLFGGFGNECDSKNVCADKLSKCNKNKEFCSCREHYEYDPGNTVERYDPSNRILESITNQDICGCKDK